MKWFGRKGVRPGPRPFLYPGWPAQAAPRDWPRSYEGQVREAYLQNPVAQRSVWPVDRRAPPARRSMPWPATSR